MLWYNTPVFQGQGIYVYKTIMGYIERGGRGWDGATIKVLHQVAYSVIIETYYVWHYRMRRGHTTYIWMSFFLYEKNVCDWDLMHSIQMMYHNITWANQATPFSLTTWAAVLLPGISEFYLIINSNNQVTSWHNVVISSIKCIQPQKNTKKQQLNFNFPCVHSGYQGNPGYGLLYHILLSW